MTLAKARVRAPTTKQQDVTIVPPDFTLHHDAVLIDRCYGLWEASGFKEIPDIYQVANQNLLYISDLAHYAQIVSYARFRANNRDVRVEATDE